MQKSISSTWKANFTSFKKEDKKTKIIDQSAAYSIFSMYNYAQVVYGFSTSSF